MGTAGRGRPSRFSKGGSAVSAFGKTTLSRALPSLLAALLCSGVPALAETPGGTRIANTATVTSGSALFSSNTVTIMVRSTATIEFLKYAPRPESGGAAVPVAETSYRTGSGGFVAIPQPPPTLNPAVPLLGPANGVPINYYLGETIYLRLTDLDQNLDPAKTEFILLTVTCRETGDTETLRLSETGPDTGIFTGYLPTTLDGGSGADGRLLIQDNCQFRASYVDSADGTDTSVSAALVDPYGIVFDSLTGAPLDGATVTLFNAGTNSPAIVFADDGVSPYPATLITGDPAYGLPHGGFRFPYIVPGNYRLVVSGLAGYGVPSTVDEARLLAVRPDAALVVGSRGENFAVDPGPALRIDIPADPLLSYLWLQKTVDGEQATVGDFLQYRLELENTNDAVAAPAVVISDRLPLGFRYQDGSTRIAGVRSANPTRSGDGRTLTFQVGDIPPKGRVVVTYVAEVAAGTKPGVATNTAQAVDGNGTASNRAKAAVTVREQFFRNKVFLLGRVLSGDCSQTDAEMSGLGGVRIYLEDGTYVVTDKAGRYHFEGIDPGVHVVQLDLDSLPAGYEARPCQVDNHFAGRTFSQFVDLQGGTLWQANFYVAPKPLPTGQISFSLEGHVAGTTVLYRLPVEIRDVAVANLQALLILPPGTGILPGSTRINGLAAADPLPVDGALAIPLGQLPPGSRHLVELTVNDHGGNSGELLAKAVLTFDLPGNSGQRTPQAENRIVREATETRSHLPEIVFSPRYPTFVAELSAADLEQLKNIAATLDGKTVIRIDAVGHADDVPIAAGSQHIHPDNQALSEARATNVVRALGEMLQLPPSKVTISGRGDREPLSLEKTAEARALNRRVELHVVAEEISSDIRLSPAPPAPPVEMPLTPRQPSPAEATPLKAEPEAIPQPGIKTPSDGSRIVDQVMQVQTVLDARLTPRLTLDGKEIPGERIGFRRTNPQANLTSYNYVGVDFGEPGVHELLFEGVDPFGNVRFSATSKVVRTGKIKRIQQVPGPDNIADGITPVAIRLRIEDLAGDQVVAPLKMQLTNGTLAPWNPKNASLRTPDDPDHNLIAVDQDGIARFAAITQAGRHTATLVYGDIVVETETWLKPAPRDWILVGFAQGTVGYNTINDNIVSAEEAGIDEHGYTDGQVKFFAKGAIKGEWLLTLAYDSDKPKLDGDSLQQIIDPDTYYPLYGDETQQGYEAASARDIYVKLERDQFYALFGDMQTGLTQTVLSQYSRSMNGFKSELQSERFAYTVFAADTKQAFVKDELRGDGTSGRYPLSQKKLVINSEEVVIETRDRFHNERIVKEERLSRHVDYDIDFEAGTLWFKRPVPSKDQEFNPVFIVVRYETAASDQANLNYGGRGAVKLLDGQVEVGASLIHEDNGAAEGDLYGADVTVKLTPQTTLRAEVAATDVEEIDDDRKGDAYLLEVEHTGEKLDARAWFRQQEAKFGLGQQNGGTGGMRTYGAEGAYRFNPAWSLSGEAWHEDNLETDARRDVATVEGRYRTDRYGLSTGLREARDKFDGDGKQTSRQLLFGGDWSTPDRKLTLRAAHEQSLGSSNDNADFPTRTMIGADYRLTRNVSLFAEQEFTWGEAEDTEGTRVGFKATPWQGGEVRTAVERESIENGERIFALFGLGQNWQVTQRWSVDLSIDRSYTIRDKASGERVNDGVPPASGGNDDFTAVSVGAAYTAERWSWWNRLETRQGDSEDKVGISSGVVGEVRTGVAVSAKLMAFITDSAGDSKRDEEEITLGMAYRPDRSRWIILERLDLSLHNEDGNGSESDGMRIVNHLHASYRASRQWQTSFYYGLKYVRENFDGDRYDGYTDMIAIETRYNITNRWDIGIHGAVLHSWNSGQFDYSLGASLGYLVMTNAWISAGYNLVGFEDEDFSDANYTAEGPYMRFRMKFDQQSVKEAAAWLNK